MDMQQYVCNVLITENPVRSTRSHHWDVPYLEQVFDPVASMVCHYITDDLMSAHDAVHLAINNEFNTYDIDFDRVRNVITRASMLKMMVDEDPVRELSK